MWASFFYFILICAPVARVDAQEPPVQGEQPAYTPASAVVDYAVYAGLLKKHVKDGCVDYLSWKKQDFEAFKAYIKGLEGCAVGDMSPSDCKAFWINAYNALAIYGVLERIPVNPLAVRFFTVKKISGFFDGVTYRVAGQNLTLDQIRRDKLVGQFHDPRIHCVLTIPAMSAPSAQEEVFRGDDVDDTIDYLTGVFLTDFRKNNLDGRSGILYLSESFSWYENDFASETADGVVDFVIEYLPDQARQYLRWKKEIPIEYLPYDWSLNIT